MITESQLIQHFPKLKNKHLNRNYHINYHIHSTNILHVVLSCCSHFYIRFLIKYEYCLFIQISRLLNHSTIII